MLAERSAHGATVRNLLILPDDFLVTLCVDTLCPVTEPRREGCSRGQLPRCVPCWARVRSRCFRLLPALPRLTAQVQSAPDTPLPLEAHRSWSRPEPHPSPHCPRGPQCRHLGVPVYRACLRCPQAAVVQCSSEERGRSGPACGDLCKASKS